MKKFLLSIFIFSTLLLPFVPKAFAQANKSAKDTLGGGSQVAPSRGLFETYLLAIGCTVNGCDKDTDIGGVVGSKSMSQEKYVIGFSPSEDGVQAVSGLTPRVTEYVTMALITPPISSSEYIADIGKNIGLPGFPTANAQGIGYKALTPVLGLWKAFRNLAYSLYIIVFLVIGVMIMLRTKINAQTIISIQNSLPNLLITLLLITFSYAIAGFVVDLIYLSMYLLVYIASANNLITDAAGVMDKVLNENVFTLMLSGRDGIHAIAARAISGVAKGVTDAAGLGGLGGITKPLAYAVIGIGILVGMFKTLWQLVQSYFMIIVLTVISPLQLLLNGLPGSKAFSSWGRNLIANAAVFPTVLAMLLFGAILMGPGTENLALGTEPNSFIPVSQGVGLSGQGESGQWIPPFLSFIDTDDGEAKAIANLQETFMALLGIFIIMMIPAAAQMTRDTLKVEQNKYVAEAFAGISQGYGFASYPVKSYIGAKQAEKSAHLQSKMLSGAINAPGLRNRAQGANSAE